ncbi:hypothetical protein RB195_014130 [Necator americanus]
MGNRQSGYAKRTAAGADAPEIVDGSNYSSLDSKTGSSTSDLSTFDTSLDEGVMETGVCSTSSEEEYGDHEMSDVDEVQKVVAEHNSAALRMEFNNLEEGWDSEFSTVSPSEMTTTDQSALPSPLTNQSTPFRLPVEKASKATTECPETTSSNAAESTCSSSSSSLNSMDTWYGLPSLIETSIKSRLEAFAKPGLDDELWIAKTHSYFDNEATYKHKPKKAALGRRLRIGALQKKSWTSMMREMALRHPLPVNPAPFPLSKAMDDLKLRPEKRFVIQAN